MDLVVRDRYAVALEPDAAGADVMGVAPLDAQVRAGDLDRLAAGVDDLQIGERAVPGGRRRDGPVEPPGPEAARLAAGSWSPRASDRGS